MKNDKIILYDDEKFICYYDNGICVMKLKKNVYIILKDLEETSHLYSLISKANKDLNISSLLLLNEPECLNIEDVELNEINNENSSLSRSRQIHVLNNLIQNLLVFNKPVLIGLRGHISTPFFGASLVADFRFADQDMCYYMSFLKQHKYPNGCLPFFLPRYVGQLKSTEMLYSENKFTAKEAKELKLINKVFANSEFEEKCISEAKKFVGLDLSSLKSTRRLINWFEKEFKCYIETDDNNLII